MNETTTQQIPPQEPRRLVRVQARAACSAASAAGLGRYFNLDPIIFRIGAIVLVLVGGAGLLAYLAALLLIPDEDAPGEPAGGPQPLARRSRAWSCSCASAGPFFSAAASSSRGSSFPLAVLVVAGVLVWWFVSGEGPARQTPATSPSEPRSASASSSSAD